MNEEGSIYSESCHLGLGWKWGLYPQNPWKYVFAPHFFNARDAHIMPMRMDHALGAWVCSPTQFLHLSIVLGVYFQIICQGSWEQNFSLYKVLWGLLNLHSWSSQGLHKSLDVIALPICMIYSWITSKNPKIAMFWED